MKRIGNQKKKKSFTNLLWQTCEFKVFSFKMISYIITRNDQLNRRHDNIMIWLFVWKSFFFRIRSKNCIKSRSGWFVQQFSFRIITKVISLKKGFSLKKKVPFGWINVKYFQFETQKKENSMLFNVQIAQQNGIEHNFVVHLLVSVCHHNMAILICWFIQPIRNINVRRVGFRVKIK